MKLAGYIAPPFPLDLLLIKFGINNLIQSSFRDLAPTLIFYMQVALTELENLTHKLNETKRETENRRDVKHIFSAMFGKPFTKTEMSKYLVRQDDVDQMSGGGKDLLDLI